MPTLILKKADVQKLLNMAEVIKAVEQAFKDWAQGKGTMPPKSYLLLEKGDFRAMPAALPGAAGVKWVNVHIQNPSLGLPTVMATLIYSDPDTGYPLAIMEATDITAYRTGATAAIASKYMAKNDPQTLGIIGAGRQSYTQLQAHLELFNFKSIKVYDPIESAVKRFAEFFGKYPVKATSIEDAANADILCTVTPARETVVRSEWIKPGTHINAIGADAKGKEELDPAILKKSIVMVDDIRQASSSGEINVPISKGLFKAADVHAELGEIILGKKKGRKDDKSITIFDSTGLAIEDIAVARMVYEKAVKVSGYLSLDFVEGKRG